MTPQQTLSHGASIELVALALIWGGSFLAIRIALDEEQDYKKADELAYQAMLSAARSLVRSEYIDVTWEAEDIVKEFRTRFFDTERFFDKYAKGKFAEYLFARHENTPDNPTKDQAHQLVEEAQLFIEACHACDMRVSAAPTA